MSFTTENDKETLGRDVNPTPSQTVHGYRCPVWNPLDSLTREDGEDDIFDLDFFVETEKEVDVVLQKYKIQKQDFSPVEVKGMEVGDDRVDVSLSTVVLARCIVYQERLLGMKTSWKDTFISNDAFNFCEVTSTVPTTPKNGISSKFIDGSTDNIDYYDVPILRLIGNVQKGDRSHSSSVTGKQGMVARRLLTPRTKMRPILQLASFIQDGCLNTARADEPKYLPSILGGSGCPPLFDNPLNSYLYVLAYKNGTYARVYASAIREAKDCVDSLDTGNPATPILCHRLRQKQEYLHATYAQSVLVPPKGPIQGPLGVPVPLYTAAGANSFLQGAERRLLATRRVVTRLEAEVETMRSHRINTVLFGTLTVPDQNARERRTRRAAASEYGFAFRANAAVKALLDREASGHEVALLIRDFGFKDTGSGQKVLSKYETLWIVTGGKGLAYTIEDLLPSEDMYLRSEVSLGESMQVPGIPLTPQIGRNYTTIETRATIGVWDTSDTLEAWADRFITDMLEYRDLGIMPSSREVLRFLENDREWVSDDSILVELAREKTTGKPRLTILLVSSDLKLGRVITHATGCDVLCVHPEVLVFQDPGADYSGVVNYDTRVEVLRRCCNLQGIMPNPTETLLDYGSLKHAAQRIEGKSNFDHVVGYSKVMHWTGRKTVTGREMFVRKVKIPNAFDFRGVLMSPNGNVRKLTFTHGDDLKPIYTGNRSNRMVRAVVKQAVRPLLEFRGFGIGTKKREHHKE